MNLRSILGSMSAAHCGVQLLFLSCSLLGTSGAWLRARRKPVGRSGSAGLGRVSPCRQDGAGRGQYMCTAQGNACLAGDGNFKRISGILSAVEHGSGLSARHRSPEISSLRWSCEGNPGALGLCLGLWTQLQSKRC